MIHRTLPRVAAAGLLLAGVAACESGGPVSPEPAVRPLANLASLTCTARVRAGTLTCQAPSPDAGDASGVVLGGQGTYVRLEGSNVTWLSGDDVWSADVTVTNLIPQALGTTDGTTVDASGVRVWFATEPTVTDADGGGPITILNHTGEAFFTSAGQKYYQWDEMLGQNVTSGTLPWEFSVPADVDAFTFQVYVAAEVQFPDGWVSVAHTDSVPMAADTMMEAASDSLIAMAYDVVGRPLAGGVTWSSSDDAIVTVDAAGALTAMAPGTATVTATVGSLSGSATLAVCPDLAVGEAYTASMPAAADLCLSGGESGNAEYTYIPVNLSTSSTLSLTLTGTGIVGVSGPPTPNLIPASGPRLAMDADVAARDDAHLRRLAEERRMLTPLMSRPETRVNRARRGGPSYLITPGVPSVGDLWSLNVASECEGTPDVRGARVVSVGTRIIIVADTTNPAGGFTTAQYDSIAAEFDSLAWNVNVDNFGAPTDLDGNGRVVAFYTRAINELSPPKSSVVVLGQVRTRDLFSSAPGSCEFSNEGEIFYMLVPDPLAVVNGNTRTVSSVRGSTVGTLAHEFQHLINASRRLYVNSAPDLEEVWLNEGLSHIAEELMFYRASFGLAPRGNINLSNLTSGSFASRRVAAFNTYANQNYGRMKSWLQRPDTTGTFRLYSDSVGSVLAQRGVNWGFLRYAADRVNGTDAALWFSLVNSTTTGKSNLQAVLGADPDAWVRDFIAAMYADDAVAGIGAEHQITSWNFRSVYGGLGGFPLGTRPLSSGVGLTLSYSAGGGSAFARFAVPTGAFASVTALSAGLPPVTPYALTVVRTK